MMTGENNGSDFPAPRVLTNQRLQDCRGRSGGFPLRLTEAAPEPGQGRRVGAAVLGALDLGPDVSTHWGRGQVI